MARKPRTNPKTTIDTKGYNYQSVKVRGRDGRVHHSRGNADAVHTATTLALNLLGKTREQIAKANKIDLDFNKFANAGQQQMALNNALRALVRAGTPVMVGNIEVKSLTQRVVTPAEAKAA